MTEQNQNQPPLDPNSSQGIEDAVAELRKDLNDPALDISGRAKTDVRSHSQLVAEKLPTGPQTGIVDTGEAERNSDSKPQSAFNKFSPEAISPIPDGTRRPNFLARARHAGSAALEKTLGSDGGPLKWK